MARPPGPAGHGTHAGYQAHRKRHERACDECLRAHLEHNRALAPMTEASLQTAVIKLCKLLGIWHYHAYQPKRDNPGFPDLVMVGRRGGLFRELKRDGQNPTTIQSEVGLRMLRAGLDWGTWRPADLQAGRVLRELEAIR